MKSLLKIFVALAVVVSGGVLSAQKMEKSAGSSNGFSEKAKRHREQAGQIKPGLDFTKELATAGKKLNLLRNNPGSSLARLSSQRFEEAYTLQAISGQSLQITWSEKGDLPVFIRGNKLSERAKSSGNALSSTSVASQGYAFLTDNSALLKIENAQEEFKEISTEYDAYGMAHVRFQQMYKGIEVWGRDVRVHFDETGELYAFNGRYIATPSLLTLDANLSKTDAKEAAVAAFGQAADRVSGRQVILSMENAAARLVWLVEVQKGYLDNWRYFVDAKSGEILKQFNRVMSDGPVTGSGKDLLGQMRTIYAYQIGNEFALIDASKPMFTAGASSFPNDGKGVIYTFDAQNGENELFFVGSNDVNDWADQVAVSASANASLVYDFYSSVFNRNAIDGEGATMNVIVNFQENLNNAFWTGQYMIFGNGDGQNFSPLAAALDVTGHEMSHGVIERTANLVYEKQPGALNESFADVFGVLFEFWVVGEQNGDWLLGEDVTTPNIAGDALRNMQNPDAANVAFGGQQPATMSAFRNLPNTEAGDNGGVHINSGITNRAFYLFATDPAVGLDKAGEVYYQALTQYLTRNAQFVDCRLAVIQAATDVFGSASAAGVAAAAKAFDAVGITDGNGTVDPAPLPTVQGDEQIAFVDAFTGKLSRFTPSGNSINELSVNALYSRPTITDDGELILYVDETTNLRILASDGSSDDALSTDGGFSNISISPNGQYLAATSAVDEAVLYLFDVVNGGDAAFPLYTPTTAQGQQVGNILYPDRIDWASNNATIMYDALNIAVNASGDTTEFWDINLLDINTGNIIRLFPPLPPGVNIGNPVFASNTDNLIALDFMDENGNVSVLAVNLNTGATGEITKNDNSLGSPTFSADDASIYYHFINFDQNIAQIWSVDFLADGITGDPNTDTGILDNALYPVAFAIGSRPTSVETETSSIPTTFALRQNFPNPFNPETKISYELPEESHVQLTVFDIRGRKVAELLSERKAAGNYTAIWNGRNQQGRKVASGIYLYRVRATFGNGKVVEQTRKMTLLK